MKPNAHAALQSLASLGLLLTLSAAAVAQTSTGGAVPVVTIQATEPDASGPGYPGVFTVFRLGDTNAALNVFYDISGTASNGVDYAAISQWVAIPAGAMSNNIVIMPINKPSNGTITKTVVLQLANPPTLNPVNFGIGVPSNAVVYLTPPAPPAVRIVGPTNGAVFSAPANISLLATASDSTGPVTNVEFFAGRTDLGRGQSVVLDPPGVNGVTGLAYWLNWQNVPANSYSLTAVATANGGISSTSAVVSIRVLPPTNLPPVVHITSPPNGAVFRAPMDLPIYAYAADPGGSVAGVQFFVNNASLGLGHPVTAVPPPSPGPIQPAFLLVVSNFWEFVWTNPPPGTNLALTAVASDNQGLAATSAPVLINLLPPLPPPTNRPALVSIVATDPIAVAGTDCWTWPGPVSPVATWSNWLAPGAAFRLFTNCGPKDATITVFRSGPTNDAIIVDYAMGGTASNGVDYVALPGTVTVSAGQRSAAITIVPLDATPGQIKTVVLTLAADPTGTNYAVGLPRAAAAMILDSRSPQPVTGVAPGRCFNVAATGPNGAWFYVEYSTDLVNWTPICTNQVFNGNVAYVDPDAAAHPTRFYRTMPAAGPPQ